MIHTAITKNYMLATFVNYATYLPVHFFIFLDFLWQISLFAICTYDLGLFKAQFNVQIQILDAINVCLRYLDIKTKNYTFE